MTSKVIGEGDDEEDDVQKNLIDISTYKQRLLSTDMKTKVVQHVPRIKLENFTDPSACLTFGHFLGKLVIKSLMYHS